MKHLSVETGYVARAAIMTTSESHTTTDNAWYSISQLSGTLPPGTYGFAINLFLTQSVTATRTWRIGVGFSGTSSSICYFNKFTTVNAATPYKDIVSYAWDQTTTLGTYASTTLRGACNIEGRFTATTSGILAPKIAKDTVAIYNINALAGSNICVWTVS